MKISRLYVLRRALAVVLCAFISFAYLPFLDNYASKVYAAEPEISDLQPSDISAITFKKAPNSDADRFVFYLGLDEENYLDEENDEEYIEFPVYDRFPQVGDTIEATLKNGSKKNIVYSEYTYIDPDDQEEWTSQCWMVDNKRFDEIYKDTSDVRQWTDAGEYELVVYTEYWNDEDDDSTFVETKIPFTVKPHPVSSIDFVPISNEITAQELEENYDDEEIKYHYDFPFSYGDKLTVSWSDGSAATVYTYKEDAVTSRDDGGEYQDDGFVDNQGNPLDDYLYVTYESDEEITDRDEPYEFTVSYKKVEHSLDVKVIPNPISAITYVPAKARKYSQAEMVNYEDFWDYEEESVYNYSIPYEYGDKLVIEWRDTSRPDTEYIYTEEGMPVVIEGEAYRTDAFVNKNDSNDCIRVYELEFTTEGPERISADTHTFESSYKGILFSTDVEVTASDEADIQLEVDKQEGYRNLYDFEDSFGLSKKIEKGEYRQAQLNEIYKAYDDAEKAIDGAKSKAEVTKAVQTYEATIRAIKTDAQLKAEEAAKAKADAEAKAKAKAKAEALEWNGTLVKTIPAAKSVKVKAAKKSVKVTWKKASKKDLKKFDKVEIQVCTDKKFQKANTKRVEVKKSKASATVKGLKKGKTYYVRVRNVKGSGTSKKVSKWSKVKKVKVKK